MISQLHFCYRGFEETQQTMTIQCIPIMQQLLILIVSKILLKFIKKCQTIHNGHTMCITMFFLYLFDSSLDSVQRPILA